MTTPNSGINTESFHHLVLLKEVNESRKKSTALIINIPHTAPKITPNKRSVPDKPVTVTRRFIM